MDLSPGNPSSNIVPDTEFAELRSFPETPPSLQVFLAGILQELRARPDHPLDMIEPALTFTMPGPAPILTSTENLVAVEVENKSSVSDLPFLSLSQAAALIRSKALSPVELTRELLACIDLIDPQVQAYVTVLH